MLVGSNSGFATGDGGGGISAKSYVQDGLIAMWDGIENAGWGVHDASQTVWTDIVGGITISNSTYNAKWKPNAFVIDSTNWSTWVSSSSIFKQPTKSGQRLYHTMELVFDIKSANNNGGFFQMYSAKIRTVYTNGTSFQESLSTASLSIYSRAGINSFSFTFDDGNVANVGGTCNITAYKNGVFFREVSKTLNFYSALVLGSTSSDANQLVVVDWYAIRCYDKILSAAEIAANYAVDKARFNLP